MGVHKILPVYGEGDQPKADGGIRRLALSLRPAPSTPGCAGGPPPRERGGSAGFTLIELMVALVVFAMLSAAGVMLLSGSVRAQGQVQERLDALAEVQRAASLMTVDLAQAVPRVSRTRTGTLAPAFYAAGGPQTDPAVQFVRTGRDNPDGLARSGLQKLEYGVVDGRLVRRSYPQADGAEPERAAALLDRVTAVGFRFRAADGTWRNDWRVTEPLAMPRAVELTVTQAGLAPVRLVFLVGADPVPPKPGANGSPGNGPPGSGSPGNG